MNILFIIGNGFDLNLGMRTSYPDFYEYYKTTISPRSAIKKLKKDIVAQGENWSDLELALGEYTKNINSLKELDIISKI